MLFISVPTLCIVHNRRTIHACWINLSQTLPALAGAAFHAFTAEDESLEARWPVMKSAGDLVVLSFPEQTYFTLTTRNWCDCQLLYSCHGHGSETRKVKWSVHLGHRRSELALTPAMCDSKTVVFPQYSRLSVWKMPLWVVLLLHGPRGDLDPTCPWDESLEVG